MGKNIRFKDYLYIVCGSIITAVSIAGFLIPAKIASGGTDGISVILYHTLGFDPGITMLLLNIPLFIIALWIFGPRYSIRAVIGTVLLSLFVSLLGHLTDYRGFLDNTESVDTLLSALFGGVLAGMGIGFVLKGGANTGGTDIVAQIVSRFTPLQVGSALFLVDSLIILAGGFVFGLEKALFAFIASYAASLSINFVVTGMGTNYAKTVFIVSCQPEKIAARITGELGHSGTLLTGKGLYSGQERSIIMTVIPNQKISRLTAIVKEADPKAFLIVEEAFQVLGEGFTPMEQVR